MNKTYHFRPCPHCGQLLRSGSMATHEPVCVKRPEIYARLRSVLASEDGKHGIARARYVELSKVDKSLPTLNTLIRRAQSPCWDGVLAFFKLSPPLPEACRSQCPRCGKLVAGGNMAEHQAECQEHKPKRTPKPKRKPQPAEPQPVALTVAPVVEREVSLPLPRIKPAAPASKWAGTLGYDPTWKAPTGDTQWLCTQASAPAWRVVTRSPRAVTVCAAARGRTAPAAPRATCRQACRLHPICTPMNTQRYTDANAD